MLVFSTFPHRSNFENFLLIFNALQEHLARKFMADFIPILLYSWGTKSIKKGRFLYLEGESLITLIRTFFSSGLTL